MRGLLDAVLKLVTFNMPRCYYHEDKIATHERWQFHYCDECTLNVAQWGPRPSPHPYADAVRKLKL